MYKFSISTKGNNDIINITSQVEDEIKKSGIKNGLALISCPGSTCGITTIEYEPNLVKDFKNFLEKLASSDNDYEHDKTWSEKNGHSHLLSSLFKPFLTIPIDSAKLLLGQWQQIIFCDFDSKERKRTINIKVLSE